jgi:hypothetical protein
MRRSVGGRTKCHEGEKPSQPIYADEKLKLLEQAPASLINTYPVDAKHTSTALPDLNVWWNKAKYQEYASDDADYQGWEFNTAVI